MTDASVIVAAACGDPAALNAIAADPTPHRAWRVGALAAIAAAPPPLTVLTVLGRTSMPYVAETPLWTVADADAGDTLRRLLAASRRDPPSPLAVMTYCATLRSTSSVDPDAARRMRPYTPLADMDRLWDALEPRDRDALLADAARRPSIVARLVRTMTPARWLSMDDAHRRIIERHIRRSSALIGATFARLADMLPPAVAQWMIDAMQRDPLAAFACVSAIPPDRWMTLPPPVRSAIARKAWDHPLRWNLAALLSRDPDAFRPDSTASFLLRHARRDRAIGLLASAIGIDAWRRLPESIRDDIYEWLRDAATHDAARCLGAVWDDIDAPRRAHGWTAVRRARTLLPPFLIARAAAARSAAAPAMLDDDHCRHAIAACPPSDLPDDALDAWTILIHAGDMLPQPLRLTLWRSAAACPRRFADTPHLLRLLWDALSQEERATILTAAARLPESAMTVAAMTGHRWSPADRDRLMRRTLDDDPRSVTAFRRRIAPDRAPPAAPPPTSDTRRRPPP